MRFWCSWYQPGEDYRPITFPPPENILGWWKSGETMEGAATLCAMVEAGNYNHARAVIRDSNAWPDAGEFRFLEVQDGDSLPGDRFPLSDWMKPRFGIE